MVDEGSVEAEVRLVWAADTVMADGLITWLDRVAMVPRVVIGVTKEALEVSTVAPARLVETVPVTVPRVVTPVVPLTTRVVTVGFTADTVTGVTSRTPPTVLMGTVRKIVPGCPGAPFRTTCVSPCWPAVASLGTAVMIFPGVPVVITFVVRIVIGVFMPALLVTPVAPGWVMMADMGMVLMMVVPCFVVVGETPLMLRIVGLFPVPPAWEVVIMVVGLPSAEVTSFSMVPAGRGPFVCMICVRGLVEAWPVTADVCTGLVCTTDIILPRLEIKVPLPPMVRGLLTRVIVLVTPPTTVVTTWACWATVTAPDLWTVMMGLVVVGEDAVAVPTWAAAVLSIRVAGLLTMTGEATFTVVVPGVTATVLRMVAPAGTLRTVPAEEGGIFCVAAAAAARAAMPLI